MPFVLGGLAAKFMDMTTTGNLYGWTGFSMVVMGMSVTAGGNPLVFMFVTGFIGCCGGIDSYDGMAVTFIDTGPGAIGVGMAASVGFFLMLAAFIVVVVMMMVVTMFLAGIRFAFPVALAFFLSHRFLSCIKF
jgi:ABC-type Na+ efflux pump permease subunit